MTKTVKSESDAANKNEAVGTAQSVPALTGLFDEMQALMAVMPGTVFDSGKPLATEEDQEAMFDNMPV